jgi:DNA-binding GntR family transcriptional regulator
MVAKDGVDRKLERPMPPARARRADPYEMLKQAILSGELAAGQQLVETVLATWCGVSRTPIREALLRLEQDGLAYRSIHGLAVRERSPEEILDLYETRIVLEAMAGRVAAERRTDHDVRLLRWNLQRGAEVSDDDSDGMVAANEDLHKAVWHASHNDSLMDLLERLHLHLARYPGTTLSSPGRWGTALAEHAELVDAIERRDADGAHAIAQGHFLEARDIRLALFAKESASR